MIRCANPFQMNDWDFRKFFTLVFSIQISLIGIVSFGEFGINIPIIRQLICFIYLTFVPGVLILRILKLHKLGNIKTVSYSVGLSLSFLMFTGFLINLIYPIFGLNYPLSFFSLILTISGLFGFLCILSYLRDGNFAETNYITIKNIPKELLIILTPFLAILGTYLVNYYNNNIILIILVLVVGSIPVLVSFGRIEKKYYPIIIFTIALSLQYCTTLISSYITGWDINAEYYYSNLVNSNLIWSIGIIGQVNSVLSIVMLAPIYSKFLNLEITWLFKIVYPFFFALIPFVLYSIFKSQTSSKIAFMSCFFFIAFHKYYSGYLGRTGIAELFLVLLVLLLLEKNSIQKAILSIIFVSSIAVSHYGLSYIFVIALITLYCLLFLYNKFKINLKGNIIENLQFKYLNLSFILFFIVFTLAWYIYTSNSSAFIAIVDIGNHMSQTIYTEFFSADSSQSLNIVSTTSISILHELTKYLHVISQVFMIIGVLVILRIRSKFKKEYIFLSIFFLVLLISSFFIPYLAGALHTDRLYQISLIFLAPFSILGGLFFINFIKSKGNLKNISFGVPLKIMSIFIFLFFLFNVGFVYECFNDQPTSIFLSQKTVLEHSSSSYKAQFFSGVYKEQEINGVKWLTSNKNKNMKIYADNLNQNLIFRSYGMMPGQYILFDDVKLRNSYIYLGNANILYSVLSSGEGGLIGYNINDLKPSLNDFNLIYSNGASEILLVGNSSVQIKFGDKLS